MFWFDTWSFSETGRPQPHVHFMKLLKISDFFYFVTESYYDIISKVDI